MAVVTVKELIDSGVHFGHQAGMWNPKMRPFIFRKKSMIHVIDLRETVRGLVRARHFLSRLTSRGAQVLFVGTKRQIKDVVASEAERVGQPLVIERWIGGTLTNFHTIRSRLDRLEELEKLEQDGTLERYSKKAQSMLRREMRKIRRNLQGVRTLEGLPGALIVVDPKREEIAVKEAAKMNVPIIAILDTDCDPDLIDLPVPGNDDALKSVRILLSRLVDAIVEGRQNLRDGAEMFRSEVPQMRGREETRQRTAAGPSDRVAHGRFSQASRSGPAESVSFGRLSREELGGKKEGAAAPAPDAVPDAVPEPEAETEAKKPVEQSGDAGSESSES